MKKIFSIAANTMACLVLLFFGTGCMKDKITRTYQIRTPVYEVLSAFRKTIKSQPAVSITNPGKITAYEKYVFLSEPGKGIHVIDNSDPSHPQNVSFINIPGNNDVAVKGSALYADAYGDLVSFDITDPKNVVAKNFGANVFPDNSIYYTGNTTNPDSINAIVGWIIKDTTVASTSDNMYPVFYNCANCLTVVPGAANSANSGGVIGTNGSTARFAIAGNYLYTVDYSNVTSFDISQNFAPALVSSLQVDWHVETIYPLKDKLFVGTNNGVYMYDIGSTPGNPAPAGQFTHVRGCDPVIADNNYAYVTINDSSACLGFNNELQVVNIMDLANSFLVQSYQLTHPIGLSKDGDLLFICDDKDGLKIYNADDVSNLVLIKQLKDAEALDVIAENGLAIVLAKDGLYQYDYSDLSNIHLISKL